MNKIEEYKKEKDGLDILHGLPRYAAEGWQAITDGDKEWFKWAGVFFRRQTPAHFMMRLRIPNGIPSARQLRSIPQAPTLGIQPAAPEEPKAPKVSFRGDEIAEGTGKLVRVK